MRQPVRQPTAAGRFYPGDPGRLRAEVRELLASAVPQREAEPIGLVLPHAGYVFSGQVAADGWRQAQGRRFDLVVLLGTNHTTAGFTGASVFIGSGYATPLGVAEVDEEAAAELLSAERDCVSDPSPHETEHSIEVQVPFVQVALPGVRILPVVVGCEGEGLCSRLGAAVARLAEGRRALVVASSDLSHFPAYDDAVASDRAVLAAMAGLDPDGLRRTIEVQMDAGRRGLHTCACGAGPALAAMTAARALGATRGTVLSHATSGDMPLGNRTRVVGYGAVMFDRDGKGTDLAALDEPAHVKLSAPGRPA